MSRTTRSAPSPLTSFFKHRTLMAAEVILSVSLLKGVLETWLKTSSMPNYGKVLLIMATTVGLLGSLYWLIEAIISVGVKRTHAMLKGMSLPRLAVHAAVLVALFFAYAAQLHLKVW